MRKVETAEAIRKRIDNSFKIVVRGGEVCLLYVDEDGGGLYYNEIIKAER